MKLSKTLFFAGMIMALVGATFSFGVNAARAADSCDPTTSDIAAITAIQNDPTLSDSQELTQELALRKQLITKTVTCAEGEVQSVQTSLAAVQPPSSASAIQSQLSDQLVAASHFYTSELTKLNTAGIAGTEQIAREILSWRKNTYTPLTAQISNFILWNENQSLFTTAQSRMDQTQRATTFLESASENSTLQNDFDAANNSFELAKNQNAAAEDALAHFLPADQSLALIKQSLDSLSATYKALFTVSDDIKAVLPQ